MIINPYIFGVPNTGNGYLYNWYAASDANFAPTDWKVPSYTELLTLYDYLGGGTISGGKLKEVGLTHWNTPNTGADNSSGFTAFGSGIRLDVDGTFTLLKYQTYYFSNQAYDTTTAFIMTLRYNTDDNLLTTGNKKRGMSIRLLYTGAGTPSTVTDYDGRVYDTVVIGTQRWTVQNWACTKLNNGDDIPNVTGNAAWAALTTLGRCAYENNESYV